MTAPDTANGRVTLARLDGKMDMVIQQQRDMLEKQDLIEKVGYEHSVQLEEIRGEMTTECARLDGRIDLVEDKVKAWQKIQSALTLTASGIAAWLGFKL